VKAAWAVVIAVALGLIFAVKTDWAGGLGLSLLVLATLLMTIDTFAERRAHPYTAALERFASNGVDATP
jgi:hypothetical protein